MASSARFAGVGILAWAENAAGTPGSVVETARCQSLSSGCRQRTCLGLVPATMHMLLRRKQLPEERDGCSGACLHCVLTAEAVGAGGALGLVGKPHCVKILIHVYPTVEILFWLLCVGTLHRRQPNRGL